MNKWTFAFDSNELISAYFSIFCHKKKYFIILGLVAIYI